MPDITRRTPADSIEITVGASEAGAEAIDVRFYSGIMLRIPTAFSTAASFRYYVGGAADGTFVEWLPSDAGESNPVTVLPNRGSDVPKGLFPAWFLKIVNAAGAGTVYGDPKG